MAENHAPSTPTAPDQTTGDSALDVTTLPPLDEVLSSCLDQLAAWMPLQRWFAHKGAGHPQLRVVGWVCLGSSSEAIALNTVIEAAFSPTDCALYQVPLTLRHPEAAAAAALEDGSEIGVLAVHGGPLRVDDALRDPLGRRYLLRLLADTPHAVGSGLRISATSSLLASAAHERTRTRLLGGEQSNTSVIVEAEGLRPVIMKLFRVLSDGANPDVVLQGALTAAGSTRVPPVLGSAVLATDGPEAIRSHCLFAQEFLPGVEDAWRTALGDAAAGVPFTQQARLLGAALAEVHRDLATALPTAEADAQARTSMADQMLERLDSVCAQVEQVQAHRDVLAALIGSARQLSWPPMQRIHGDLHLGQVLATPDRGWVLLDFEGEPLRSLQQRSLPDSPLRDIAGMLRSLDYVAGSVALEQGRDVSAWSADARAAFLEGYGPVAGIDAETAARLLDIFEADKAVYEALYEARNRPDWLPIPLGALDRISSGSAPAE